MKRCKTWLIIGGAHGLGAAAIKYLSAKAQQVIVFEIADLSALADEMISKRFGTVDYIINNSNYSLFHTANPDLRSSAQATINLLTHLTRCLKKDPPGTIINLPPQLCLATLDNPSAGPKLQSDMNFFLALIREGLSPLGFPLSILEPGERLL